VIDCPVESPLPSRSEVGGNESGNSSRLFKQGILRCGNSPSVLGQRNSFDPELHAGIAHRSGGRCLKVLNLEPCSLVRRSFDEEKQGQEDSMRNPMKISLAAAVFSVGFLLLAPGHAATTIGTASLVEADGIVQNVGYKKVQALSQ
jgi:hypothetical protein